MSERRQKEYLIVMFQNMHPFYWLVFVSSGDRIVEINGVAMEGLNRKQVFFILTPLLTCPTLSPQKMMEIKKDAIGVIYNYIKSNNYFDGLVSYF